MNYNYTLKYRTFESLLEDVKLDLRSLATDGTVDPAQLIKVAIRVNYDLGLRIYMTKERVLEVCKSRVKLPDDFFVMNFALLCGQAKYTFAPPQGTNIQQVTRSPPCLDFIGRQTYVALGLIGLGGDAGGCWMSFFRPICSPLFWLSPLSPFSRSHA